MFENDFVEAIIALPEGMFYNTPLGTFIWVLSNKKAPNRKGKVQLINATEMKQSMWKNMCKKNSEITVEHDECENGDEGISFIRTIQCPECAIEFEVDLAEYVYDVSSFEKDSCMGPDAVHSFDSEANCKCPYCGKILHIEGWIREYPIGAFDSEEIDVNTFEDDE